MYLVSRNSYFKGSTGYYVKSFYHLQRQLGGGKETLDNHLLIVGQYKKAQIADEDCDGYGTIKVVVSYNNMFTDKVEQATFYLLKMVMLGEGE